MRLASSFECRSIALLLAAVLAVAVPITAWAASKSSSERAWWDHSALVEALRQGGHVLVIRHERTEVPSREDDYTRPPNDCRAQRNLSVAGAAGAHETGVVLSALDIKVDRVITSPMCRSAETARYLFGVGYRIDPRLMHEDPAGGRGIETASKEMRALLAELAPIPEGSNVAVVGHGGVIHRATGLALSEGEIGVVRVGADGATEAVGQVLGSDFAPLARQALQTKDAAHPTPNSPHSR